MNVVQELLQAVQASGVTIRMEGSDLNIRPARVLKADLKIRLKEHKADILRYLETEFRMQRLQASSVSVAILREESMQIRQSGREEANLLQSMRGACKPPASLWRFGKTGACAWSCLRPKA